RADRFHVALQLLDGDGGGLDRNRAGILFGLHGGLLAAARERARHQDNRGCLEGTHKQSIYRVRNRLASWASCSCISGLGSSCFLVCLCFGASTASRALMERAMRLALASADNTLTRTICPAFRTSLGSLTNRAESSLTCTSPS